MPTVDLVIGGPVSTSMRARQVSAVFDVPPQDKQSLRWSGDVPFDAAPWNVGLIVGPSGSGKTTLLRHLFGAMPELSWSGASVVDDVRAGVSVEEIARAFGAVGFNTIPAWLRPFAVLSNGERFRVDVARRLIELPDPVVIDEFTSVVDRQVAAVASHAIGKEVRRQGRRVVVATCHYDVTDWLQPDWVLEPATMAFSRRSVQRRPWIDCEVRRVPWDVWRQFAPFHYLTASLHRSARVYALHVAGRPVACAATLHRPHPRCSDVTGVSRLVTLPDWQGVGLAFALVDRLGAATRALGRRLHTYPAHPGLIRSFDRSGAWACVKRPGYSRLNKRTFEHSTLNAGQRGERFVGRFGARPSATFEYVGPPMTDAGLARAFLCGEREACGVTLP